MIELIYLDLSIIVAFELTPVTAARKADAAFGTKGVTSLRVHCYHLLHVFLEQLCSKAIFKVKYTSQKEY